MGSAGEDPHWSVEQCCRGTLPTALLLFYFFFFFKPFESFVYSSSAHPGANTAAESGITAIVTVNQSLVLAALCLDFFHFGHSCSKLNTPNDCVSFCINLYLCVFWAYTIKYTNKVGIEVQI